MDDEDFIWIGFIFSINVLVLILALVMSASSDDSDYSKNSTDLFKVTCQLAQGQYVDVANTNHDQCIYLKR